MLPRQAMTGMSGVFSRCFDRSGASADPRETRIAQIIAISFGILWAVVIGLTVMNGA
jgi:hypothetical protein